MNNTAEAIRSLVIPVGGTQLVLPNAAVAEVIPYMPADDVDNAPAWLLGTINWRDQTIPLLSFEVMAGFDRLVADTRSRIAVLNATSGHAKLRFFGIVTRDITHLLRLDASSIAPDADGSVHSGVVLSNVIVDGEAGVIPNLEALEAMVLKQV